MSLNSTLDTSSIWCEDNELFRFAICTHHVGDGQQETCHYNRACKIKNVPHQPDHSQINVFLQQGEQILLSYWNNYNNNDKDISGSCRTNNKDMNPVNMHAVCAQIRLIMKKLLETFDGVPGENLLGGGRECIKWQWKFSRIAFS